MKSEYRPGSVFVVDVKDDNDKDILVCVGTLRRNKNSDKETNIYLHPSGKIAPGMPQREKWEKDL